MESSHLIRAARGLEPADLVLKGGRVVDVFSGTVIEADVAVKDGHVVGIGRYQGRDTVDVSGRYIAPGFIDSHLHLESSMIGPVELARGLVPRGASALIADPHEIANVLGLRGIFHLLGASENLPLDIFFMAPSCVPATHLETSGASLGADNLAALVAEPRVLGLAEVMNFPGVLSGDPDLLKKIELFSEKIIDGHAPLLSGPDLCAYAAAGISTDHECTNVEEAAEKLARGLRILIREGSQARNLAALAPMISDRNFRRIAFCSDDRDPEDILANGHLDHILRRAVEEGVDPIQAVTMTTLNPAEFYRLRRRGAVAPGYRADLVVLKSLTSFEVEQVYRSGVLVAEGGEMTVDLPRTSMPEGMRSMNIRPFSADDLRVRAVAPKCRVMGLVRDQLITEHLVLDTPERGGWLAGDAGRDIARLVVVERHRATGNIGQGLVRGLGLRQGAIASSVAHDSHNVVAAGLTEPEIHLAVETVRRMGGGQAVVAGESVLAVLPLPLAGLMSERSLRETAEACRSLKTAAAEVGCGSAAPFMALSFLALPVIPSLKLTDRGLVNVDRFEFVDLFVI